MALNSKHRRSIALTALTIFLGATRAGSADATLIHPLLADAGTPAFTMTYNGGPVLTGAVKAFAIYYGDFTSANAGSPVTAQTVFNRFLGNLTGSTYLNIGSTFTGAKNGPVSENIAFGGSANLTDYLGTYVSDANIQAIIAHAEALKLVPKVANALYFVDTAPGIAQQEDGSACGWHDGNARAHTLYSWISPSLGCDYVGHVSGNAVGDSFTETGSHELFEMLTDPFPASGYSSSTVGEVGDVCVSHNFAGVLNGVKTDLQSIWALDPKRRNGGACAEGATFAAHKASFGAPASVGEPASMALAFIGLGGLVMARRARRMS